MATSRKDYAEPLSNLECLKTVVDGKGENKHRYVVASQDAQLRRLMREIPGRAAHLHSCVSHPARQTGGRELICHCRRGVS